MADGKSVSRDAAGRSVPYEEARVALIPGGARGIGRAIAEALASEGWSVAIAYRTSEAAAHETVAALEALGARAVAFRRDVALRSESEALVRETRAMLGDPSALVHCAGPYHRVALLDEDPTRWREAFDANLHAFFDLVQLVAPAMRARGHGRVLAFGLAGAERLQAQPMLTAHSIAKAGLIALARSFAQVLAPDGITVNTISPGFVDSGNAISAEWAHMAERIPAGRLGELADVVAAARFLLSDEARYVTGANLVVSGGWGV